MTTNKHLVFLVDDDPIVRDAIGDLLASVGFQAVSFASVGEYLSYPRPNVNGCLVLDIELPDINGLDFQEQIINGDHPPVVFITGRGDVPSSVRAMKHGAVDFLMKPFQEAELLSAVQAAIEADRVRRNSRAEFIELSTRLRTLTPRERDVLPLIVGGLLNKQAAAELGISEVTLQIHRGKVMQKMRADSLADLVRMAAKLGIQETRSRHGGASNHGVTADGGRDRR